MKNQIMKMLYKSNNQRKSRLKSRFGYTKKTEIKRELDNLTKKLETVKLVHMILLAIALTYWIVMLYIGNRPLMCDEVKDHIKNTLGRNKTESDTRLMFHPSVDYEHAVSLENLFKCHQTKNGCQGYAETFNITLLDGKTEHCAPNGTELSEEEHTICNQRCVPEPYMMPNSTQDIAHIDYQPIAIEWYATIHFWDILWVIVSSYIQIRLRSLEKNSISFGPMIIDEKDIAATSLHIMTVFVTLSFYSVDLTMSTLWMSLHEADGPGSKDHGSYWTIYERNSTLSMLHAIYVAILFPILVLAFFIKDAFTKYENIQFMTEMNSL